jgi:hypothetical protein
MESESVIPVSNDPLARQLMSAAVPVRIAVPVPRPNRARPRPLSSLKSGLASAASAVG